MTAVADSNPPGELYCPQCEKTFHVGERCPTDGARLMKLKARIDPFLGRDLDGRYTVIEKLGQGGMGAVYRAEQHSVGREVAVKVVNSNLVSEPEVIKRFLREAKLASRLAHPNAVAVLDFNQTEDGVFYLVMELVTGRTLDLVIKSERVFKPERIVRIGTQVLDALDGAHALSIVHRDLKPSNIILLSQGRDLIKVLDFGLAKSVSPDQTSTTMTNAGAIVGTPAFMPPELATGMPCDGRADLYSLGCILYLMGSGRLPFMSDSVHELLALHGCDEPAPPMTGVPHRLAAVIDKLLQKNPANRFQNAAEALQALETSLTIATPAHGVSVWPNETSPSLGPFPATTQNFAHLQTPAPQAIAMQQGAPGTSDRRRPSSTDVERMAAGETMLAAGAPPVAATSQPGTSSMAGLDVPARKRWPLFAGIGLVLGAAVTVALVMGQRPSPTSEPSAAPIDKPAVLETPPPAAVVTPPEPEPTTPPAPTEPPPVEPPIATTEATAPPTKPADKPGTSGKSGKSGKLGKSGTSKPAKPPTATKPATPTTPPPVTPTKPAGATKPAVLPF